MVAEQQCSRVGATRRGVCGEAHEQVQSDGHDGNVQPTDGDRSTPEQDFLERTTGFEPATLTLATR